LLLETKIHRANTMTQEEFWDLIEASRQETENPDEQTEVLQDRLKSLSEAEILSFADHFRTYHNRLYTWDHWGVAYILQGGCSDDAFTDYRTWIIAQGRALYLEVLEDPQAVGDLVGPDEGEETSAESVLYAAFRTLDEMGSDAWENHEPPVAAEFPSGEPWEEEPQELRTRFPRVWAKFGW
jgi:hypothetical protein